MAPQRIAQAHARLHRSVKTQHADSILIDNADVVIRRGDLENDGRVAGSARSQQPATNRQKGARRFHSLGGSVGGALASANHRSINRHSTPSSTVSPPVARKMLDTFM